MSRLRVLNVVGLACASVLSVSSIAQGTILGPSEYRCFDTTESSGLVADHSGDCSGRDSPFAADYNSGLFTTYFHLETFEDGLLNTPGLSADTGFVTSTSFSGPIIDSVDADDGSVNGIGTGDSYFGSGPTGINFSFDASALGGLPTHVGLVWTDGLNNIHFVAYDENGNSLGSALGSHADSNHYGGTGEDRFYGAINSGGISRIFISNDSGGIEVDHLQYGLMGSGGGGSAPAPAALGFLGLGLMGLGITRRRRQAR